MLSVVWRVGFCPLLSDFDPSIPNCLGFWYSRLSCIRFFPLSLTLSFSYPYFLEEPYSPEPTLKPLVGSEIQLPKLF